MVNVVADMDFNMKSWSYRVMKQTVQGEVGFQIHEVFYEDEKITGWTSAAETGGKASAPFGDTLEELKSDLEMMKKALDLPVLDYETGKEIEK